MNVPSDDQIIAVIHPDAMKVVLEYAQRARQTEAAKRALAEKINAMVEATAGQLKEIMDAFAELSERMAEALGEGFHSLAELFDEIVEMTECLDDDDDEGRTRRAWRSAEKRFSQVSVVRYKQFERNRAERCTRTRGRFRIGGTGRRTGPRKGKRRKTGKGGGRYAAGRQNDGRNDRRGGEAGACGSEGTDQAAGTRESAL